MSKAQKRKGSPSDEDKLLVPVDGGELPKHVQKRKAAMDPSLPENVREAAAIMGWHPEILMPDYAQRLEAKQKVAQVAADDDDEKKTAVKTGWHVAMADREDDDGYRTWLFGEKHRDDGLRPTTALSKHGAFNLARAWSLKMIRALETKIKKRKSLKFNTVPKEHRIKGHGGVPDNVKYIIDCPGLGEQSDFHFDTSEAALEFVKFLQLACAKKDITDEDWLYKVWQSWHFRPTIEITEIEVIE